PVNLKIILESAARQLNLKTIPQISLSEKVCCPAVFGVFRPVMLLPKEEFENISEQDAENMFLHELAHIKRGDLLIHAFYMCLQIVYWFNPLLWLIRRHLQNLRELCCDATVARILRERTATYRQTLLETARRLIAEPADPGMGLLGLFENSGRLIDRLRWLEKKSWRYRPLRIATVFILICLMSACVLPMAKKSAQEQKSTSSQEQKQRKNRELTRTDTNSILTTPYEGFRSAPTELSPTGTSADAPAENTEKKDFSIKLSNGATVELVGICEHPSKGKQWWKADGSNLENTPYDKVNVSIGSHGYEAAVLISNFNKDDGIGYVYQIEGAQSSGAGECYIDKKNPKNMYGVVFDQQKEKTAANIKLGIAAGSWETIQTQKPNFSGVYNNRSIVWHGPIEEKGQTILHTTHKHTKMDVRITAVDKLGKEHKGGSSSGSIGAESSSMQTRFDVALSDIKEFQFQTRPYEWVEFKNVSLKPEVKTDVQIVFIKENEQPNDQRALLLQEAEILEQSLHKIKMKYDAGEANSTELMNASVDFLRLKSKIAKTPQQKITILGQIVSLYDEYEKSIQTLVEAGRVSQEDLNKIKLQKLEAQRELAQAEVEIQKQSTEKQENEPSPVQELTEEMKSGISEFEKYFPDDKEAGKLLDSLYETWERQDITALIEKKQASYINPLSNEEIFKIVQNGFRRTTKDKSLILRYLGNLYIWGKKPQNQTAIDIMYYATFSQDQELRHYAEYFGLTVVDNKSPEILKRLAELSVYYPNTDIGRIIWGVQNSNQTNDFAKLIGPFANSSNDVIKTRADEVLKKLISDVYIEDFKIQPYEAGGLYTLQVKIVNAGPADVPWFRMNFYKGKPEDNINLFGKAMAGSYGAGPIKAG
ncbi:MAG: M56 family metallopeptidase, partial [Phycisphaerales bacterium]